MQQNESRWRVRREVEPTAVEALAREVGVSRLAAWALASRGFDAPEQARAFLAPSLARDWPDAGAIPGLDEAAERVARAVRNGERVIVFGDFDLDGVSAAGLLTLALRSFGGKAGAVVPHRVNEGYGLSQAAIERVLAKRPDLVVTVDCGVSSKAEVDALRAAGVDVVVTDHHEPGDGLPEGVPVADPKLAANGPELSGAGVALALVKAVGERLGDRSAWLEYLDLATLGTIADIVPLLGPNRALVAAGLERMRTSPRLGVRALAEAAGIDVAQVTSERVAFALGPRLNAAGRMADPVLALRLLMTEDEEEARSIAGTLDEHNRSRQVVELSVFKQALELIEAGGGPEPPLIIVAGEGWHDGVRGIVASRLAQRFGIPALVLCVEDGLAVGSGRSVPGLDLYDALGAVRGMLDRFGGHEAAVGFALPAQQLGEFRRAAKEALAPAFSALPPRATLVDGVVGVRDIDIEGAADLDLLEPFGFGNPRPVFAFAGVRLDQCRSVGPTGQHAVMQVCDEAAGIEAIMFRCPDIASLERLGAADLIASVERSVWRGRERVRLLVQEVLEPQPAR